MNHVDLNTVCESPAGVTLWAGAVRQAKLSQNHSPHSGFALEWGFLRFWILGRAWVPKCGEVGSCGAQWLQAVKSQG